MHFKNFLAPSLLILLLFSSCARQESTRFQITTLQAVDLEETLTRHDELMLAYTLTSFDAIGKAVGVVNGSWGIVEARTGQVFPASDFKPIEIPFPKNGKVVASLVLVEVDDYAQAQKTLATIKKYHEFIKIPAALAELADVALTPLKYLSLGLTMAGVGFQLTDRLDGDDILGQSSTELTYRQARLSPVVRVPLTFRSQHLGTGFHYEMAYDLSTGKMAVKPRR